MGSLQKLRQLHTLAVVQKGGFLDVKANDRKKSGYPLVMTNITDGKITMLLMGKSTISMAIFNSYVKLPEGISH